ncbi:MAG: ABC transporter permease [Ferruginibacter sp.]
MFRNYFKIAIRGIWKNKVFSSINIIGLALSMACCLVISMYVWNEWQHDKFHKDWRNIYRVTEKQDQAGVLYNVAVTPGPLAPQLQKDFPEIVNAVRFGNWGGLLKNGTHTYEEKNIQLTDNSIFKVFNFPLIKGNPATALQSPGEIVITEKIAEKYFGKDWQTNPAILGETFRFNNEFDFKVAGIAKNLPTNSSIQFDILLPLSYLFNSDKFSYKWNSNNYHTYLQLKPGTNISTFGKKIEQRLHSYNADTKDVMILQPLRDQYLKSAFDFSTDWGKRGNIKYIKIFAGVGFLLLIIACVNFINLSTARSVKRSLEVGIRKVNGASRKQLVLQFLSESLLMAFVAGVLAVFIISCAQPLLESITGVQINTIFLQSMFVPFFLCFIVLIGLLAGLYPALILSAYNPVKVLKKAGGIHFGRRFRQALVIGQFAISVTLIICTSFMYRQLRFIQQKDLGFDKALLLNVRLGGQLAEKPALFMHDIGTIPGVANIAPTTMSLANVENSSYMEWEGMQKDEKFLVTQANVDPGFLPTLNMRLVSGQNFSRQLTNDTANYIVNESAVKRMGYNISNAIGKAVTFWGTKGRIIGVVKDFNFKPLNSAIEPFIFRYQPRERYFSTFIKILPGYSQPVIKQVERLYKKYETEAPFEFSFLDDKINQQYLDDKRTASIILVFANLTIFVGCLGLFGLTVFSAEQRIKEIGIRKVLGAGLASIITLLSKDFLKLVVTAIVIAVPVAWYITGKWLENYAYRISIEWWVFVLTVFSVVGLAAITISIQAIRTAIANPVNALRTE